MEQTDGKIIEAIEKLADTLGRTVESLWPEIVKAYVIAEIGWTVATLVVAVGFALIGRYLLGVTRGRDKDEFIDADWPMIGCVACYGMAIVLGISFIYLLAVVCQVLFAPEGYVALELMNRFASGG